MRGFIPLVIATDYGLGVGGAWSWAAKYAIISADECAKVRFALRSELVWTFLTIFALLFEIWLGTAYLFAFLQTRERLLLLQVGQAIMIGGVFGYIMIQLWNQTPLNATPIYVMLGISLVLMVIWRRSLEGSSIGRAYPKGMADILAFRRPASDLKRRVRTK